MNAGQLFEVKLPAENPDWGFARNCRTLLRRRNSEFMQSVFSVEAGGFTTPNRDYPSEGLSALVDGENWKFLDALAFRLEAQQKPLKLRPAGVKAFPWKSSYSYSAEGHHSPRASLEVEYYLLRESKPASLCVLFRLSGMRNTSLFLRPFFDIRHMYSPSSPESHSYSFSSQGLCVRAQGKQAVVASPAFTSFSPSAPAVQDWWYKLGAGFREERGGATRFAGENRSLYAPGLLSAELRGEVSIRISCGEDPHRPSVELVDHDEKRERARALRLLSPFSGQLDAAGACWGTWAQKALACRTLCLLDKFDLSSAGFYAPDAGSMWFRNIWFRDAFEGARNNLPLYLASRKRDLRALIVNALALEKDGSIPNKLPEKAGSPPDYSSADATLLCLLTAVEYLSVQRDPTLSEKVLQVAAKFASSARNSGVLTEEGLLKTPASHSWIDSFVSLAGTRATAVPSRIPAAWLADFQNLPAAGAAKDASESRFYLSELNALWLLVLRGLSMRGMRDASETCAHAEKSFRKLFFGNGRLAGIADAQGRKSFDEASPCIQSLAMLPDLFSDAEAKTVLESNSDCLVFRDKKLFGILVKRSPERAYYDDRQYHGSVCWPRDSYYLYKLLRRLNDDRAEQILLSALEHQQEEGAIFYSHELFSLPEGNNPSPTADAHKPVPVKNPAQYFSQWCQPYYEFLGAQATD